MPEKVPTGNFTTCTFADPKQSYNPKNQIKILAQVIISGQKPISQHLLAYLFVCDGNNAIWTCWSLSSLLSKWKQMSKTHKQKSDETFSNHIQFSVEFVIIFQFYFSFILWASSINPSQSVCVISSHPLHSYLLPNSYFVYEFIVWMIWRFHRLFFVNSLSLSLSHSLLLSLSLSNTKLI